MLTGTETVLKSSLIAAIQAGVLADCGTSPISPNCINGLAKGIADAVIPHLVANIEVASTTVPGTGLLDSVSGPVSGTANTVPGTIS